MKSGLAARLFASLVLSYGALLTTYVTQSKSKICSLITIPLLTIEKQRRVMDAPLMRYIQLRLYSATEPSQHGMMGKHHNGRLFANCLMGHGSPATSSVYAVFSSYGVAYMSFTLGACNKLEGAPTTLSAPFSAFVPHTPGSTGISWTIASSLVGFLGYTDCGYEYTLPRVQTASPLVPSLSLLPSAGGGSSSLPASSLGSNLSSSPSAETGSSGLKLREIIIISTIISVLSFALILLAFFTWRKAQSQKRHSISNVGTDQTDQRKDVQPYLQQKSELEADERRVYEMDTKIALYEMASVSEMHETTTSALRPELRGDEHASELGASHVF